MTLSKLFPLFLLLPALLACPSMGSGEDPTALGDLTEAEFSRLERRASAWARVVAWAAVDEGVDRGDVERVADLLEDVARDQSVIGGAQVLASRAELEGWEGAALLALVTELDLYLEGRGVWEAFGPRTQRLLESIGAAIREGAAEEPSSEDQALALEEDASAAA